MVELNEAENCATQITEQPVQMQLQGETQVKVHDSDTGESDVTQEAVSNTDKIQVSPDATNQNQS